MKTGKAKLRQRRHGRVRVKITGTSACPRLSVYRSLKHIQVQLINDAEQKTLAAVSDRELKGIAKASPRELAHKVGKLAAERARQQGIVRVVFDRGGYAYHGRVRAVAEGARAGGLEF